MVAALVAIAVGPAPAQVLSGYDLFRMHCDGCHDLPDPENPRRTREQWQQVLKEMVEVRGATLSPREMTAVLNFLDSFNQPRREIEWVETPAPAISLLFRPQQAGPLPESWVPLIPRSNNVTPWAVQTDATGRLAFLAPSRPAAAGEQSLLLDNRGIVTNGTIATRLRLASGKQPAAGIVFGFRNEQRYFGARIGAPGPTGLLLYEIDPDGQALLGRVATSARVGDWVTLSLTLAAKEATIAVDGKPALRRPVERYRGGHVGLATFGDTIAWFDRWSVAVR